MWVHNICLCQGLNDFEIYLNKPSKRIWCFPVVQWHTIVKRSSQGRMLCSRNSMKTDKYFYYLSGRAGWVWVESILFSRIVGNCRKRSFLRFFVLGDSKTNNLVSKFREHNVKMLCNHPTFIDIQSKESGHLPLKSNVRRREICSGVAFLICFVRKYFKWNNLISCLSEEASPWNWNEIPGFWGDFKTKNLYINRGKAFYLLSCFHFSN